MVQVYHILTQVINADYFPKDYTDARARFLRDVQNVPGEKQTLTWDIPSRTERDLATDVLFLPPLRSAGKLFVLISGVHGLEGYAGNALQSMFLREFLPRLNRQNTGVLMIHALNPFGFKHHRRGTEGNVNLNRNCSTNGSLYSFKNPAALELVKRFIPRTPVEATTCHLMTRMRRENGSIWFDDVALDEFVKGVGMGQFESNEALEFGGFGPEPQIEELIAQLKKLMPDYQDIVLLDLHTGLGDRGRLHLLTGDTDGSVHPALFKELFDVEKDKEFYAFTPAEEEGFYKTLGATNNIFPELARPHQRVCALTMEFGTLGHDLEAQLLGLNRWMLEEQGLIFGYKNPQLEKKLRADYFEKFFPSDPAWRKSVIAAARGLFERVFTRAGVLN